MHHSAIRVSLADWHAAAVCVLCGDHYIAAQEGQYAAHDQDSWGTGTCAKPHLKQSYPMAIQWLRSYRYINCLF
jgi:hypothetical protein